MAGRAGFVAALAPRCDADDAPMKLLPPTFAALLAACATAPSPTTVAPAVLGPQSVASAGPTAIASASPTPPVHADAPPSAQPPSPSSTAAEPVAPPVVGASGASPALLAQIDAAKQGTDYGYEGLEVQLIDPQRSAIVGFVWAACANPGVQEIALVCVGAAAQHVKTPAADLMRARLAKAAGHTYAVIESWDEEGTRRLRAIYVADTIGCWSWVPEELAPKALSTKTLSKKT